MKILTINYEYPPLGGGGGVAHKVLVDEWKKEHDITLVTTLFSKLSKYEVAPGLKIYRCVCFRKGQFSANIISLLLFPISSFGILWKLRKEKFEIINAQFAVPSGVAGVIAKRLFRIPLVLSIHGGDIYDPTKTTSPHRLPLVRGVVRWVLNNSDLVVSQSNNTRHNAEKYYHPKSPSSLIPLPYEEHDLTAQEKAKVFTYVSVGRLVKRKAFDDLIKAFARVKKSAENTTLIIIGDGPEKEYLQGLINELGLAESVNLAGYVSNEEKFSLLQQSTCYVLSSVHEGLGIVLQEAMECGLPIVSTNNGGQTDIVRQDENAELVPPSQPDELAKAMLKLYQQPELLTRYGNFNKKMVESFAPERISGQYIDAFTKLTKANLNKK